MSGDREDRIDPPGLGDHLRSIKAELREKPADELGHEFPGLVEAVASASREHEDTRRFIIGVSFTPNRTGLDYQLHRLLEDQADDGTVVTLKPPVDGDHGYLVFPYPPDPRFDAKALRGALLAAIEDAVRSAADDEDADGDGLTGLISELSWNRFEEP